MSGPGALLERLQATKPWRAWQRYGDVRGNVLAGGVAYFAFFSLFPALAIGFTVFGFVVQGRPDLQLRLAQSLNDTFGTVIIGTSPGQGVATVDDLGNLVGGDVLTLSGLVGLGVLIFTGLGWIGALRDGVSAVFSRPDAPNPVVSKAADLGVLAVFGLTVLASVVGSVLVTATTGPVLDWLGIARRQAAAVLISVLTALVVLAIDTGTFLLLFRVLPGVRVALDDVFTGALAGAVGLGLLKLGGGALLRLASGNQFLAAFSIVVGLLIWMNIASRVALFAAAWAATTSGDRGHLPPESEPQSASEPSPAGTSPAGAPLMLAPTYGVRAADRTTLLAGAVLGATAAVGARVLGEVGRSVGRQVGRSLRRGHQDGTD